MKIAVLMDALEQVVYYKDSTVAMLKAALDKGWQTYCFQLEDMFCEEGRAFAKLTPLTAVRENQADWCDTGETFLSALAEMDIILMRKDPPFDIEYIYATYALELAEKEGVLVANKPQSLRDANEKFFTLNFPQCCPQTLVSRDMTKLRQFWELHQNVIFKPLEGMGGKSVFHVDKDGRNLSVILETLSDSGEKSVMAQSYIPEIASTGDKRILLINGEPVPYSLARIPEKGELRGNLAAGAKGVVKPVSEREQWICQQLAPSLQAKGLYFVGIDVIGGYLTEINVTSPTCIREIANETGLDIAADYLSCLESLRK